MGIVDEKGRPIWNDVLVALFAKDVLQDHPGATIMFNLLCSKVVPETISGQRRQAVHVAHRPFVPQKEKPGG